MVGGPHDRALLRHACDPVEIHCGVEGCRRRDLDRDREVDLGARGELADLEPLAEEHARGRSEIRPDAG
jgi:hypothetical protein